MLNDQSRHELRSYILSNLVYLLMIFGLCSCSTGQKSESKLTSSRSAASITIVDSPYHFDPSKLKEAHDAFHFLRTYVDYFYLLLNQNHQNLESMNHAAQFWGWCVGDAHAENFGTLLQNNEKALFTMNDMDDAGDCPVVYDVMRFMVSSELYDSNLDIKELMKAYLTGLEDNSFDKPDSVKKMAKDSEQAGFPPKSKKINGNQLVRDPQSAEVATKLAQEIASQIKVKFPNLMIMDMYKTENLGGGSGGLTRFEVLVSTEKNNKIILELKTLVAPAVASIQFEKSQGIRQPLPITQEQRIQKALYFEQGPHVSNYYNVIKIAGVDMLIRPRFSGNLGVTLADNNSADNHDIMLYEIFRLGQIHRQSVSLLNEYIHWLKNSDPKIWEHDVDSMRSFFKQKFRQTSGL